MAVRVDERIIHRRRLSDVSAVSCSQKELATSLRQPG